MKIPQLLKPPPLILRVLRSLPVTKRGTLFILSGLLLVLLVFGGFSAHTLQRAVEQRTTDAHRSAGVTAQGLDDFLRQGMITLETGARWPGVGFTLELLQSGKSDILPPWLTLYFLVGNTPVFKDCTFVIGKDGKVLWTNPPGLGLLGRDLSVYSDIQKALKGGETHISNVIRDGFRPFPYILIATAIRNPRQEVVGVIGGVLDLATLKSVGESHGLGRMVGTGNSYIVDGEGVIIASTHSRRALTQAENQIVQVVLGQREATLFPPQNGNVLIIQPLSLVRWGVAVEYSGQTFYRDVARAKRNLVGIGAALAAIALLFWIPFVDSFVSPLKGLTEEANRIASGELSHPIPADGQDEITSLSRSLEHMRQKLEEDQARLQAQIRELTHLNHLKNEFITNLSHEFRTPLCIINGYLEFAEEGMYGELPNELQKCLRAARAQNEILGELIDSCLVLAKLDGGDLGVEAAAFDLCQVVREVMDEFQLQFRAKGLRGLTHVPYAPCVVKSDKTKMTHILRHLVSNAIKFTEQGKIEVSVENGPNQDTATLHVRDSGIGIRKEDQEIIFERFRQLDGSSTRSYGGVGLGLSVCKELVQRLGGTISVTSTPGAGSTFSVTLPRASVSQDSASARVAATYGDTTDKIVNDCYL